MPPRKRGGIRKRLSCANYADEKGGTLGLPTVVLAKVGAPGRFRTSTMLPSPDFESGASTSSATGAIGGDHSGGRPSVNVRAHGLLGRQFRTPTLCESP